MHSNAPFGLTFRVNEIKKAYVKKSFQSNYGSTYGHREVDFADPTILKFRKFSEMNCGEVINPRMLKYLDTWASKGDDEQYSKLVISALKAIYTRSRQEKKPASAYNHLHPWFNQYDKFNQERVDLVTSNNNSKLILDRASRNRTMNDKGKRVFKKYAQDPVREAKLKAQVKNIEGQRKTKLMQGNGPILSFYDPVDGRPSCYQQQYRNQPDTAQCENMMMSGNFASGIMTITPDPRQTNQIKYRSTIMQKDLQTLTTKLESPT